MKDRKTYWVIKIHKNYKGEQLYLSRAIINMTGEQDFEETKNPSSVIRKYASKQSCKRAINTWYEREFLDAKEHWQPVQIINKEEI